MSSTPLSSDSGMYRRGSDGWKRNLQKIAYGLDDALQSAVAVFRRPRSVQGRELEEIHTNSLRKDLRKQVVHDRRLQWEQEHKLSTIFTIAGQFMTMKEEAEVARLCCALEAMQASTKPLQPKLAGSWKLIYTGNAHRRSWPWAFHDKVAGLLFRYFEGVQEICPATASVRNLVTVPLLPLRLNVLLNGKFEAISDRDYWVQFQGPQVQLGGRSFSLARPTDVQLRVSYLSNQFRFIRVGRTPTNPGTLLVFERRHGKVVATQPNISEQVSQMATAHGGPSGWFWPL